MSIRNENSLKKLVGMLIEVLHGEYQDTRDLAIVQLSIFGEKAVPYISRFLEDEAEKEGDMMKYFVLYKAWKVQDWKASEDEGKFRSIYVQGWILQELKKNSSLKRYGISQRRMHESWQLAGKISQPP